MACEDCFTARVYLESTRKTYNPACLFCGARYWQQVAQFFEPGKVNAARSRVLDVWAAMGHDRTELVTIGMESVVPFEQLERKKR